MLIFVKWLSLCSLLILQRCLEGVYFCTNSYSGTYIILSLSIFLCPFALYFVFVLTCLVSDTQVRKSWDVSWMANHMWMVRFSSHPAKLSANVQVEEWPACPCALKMSACPAQTAHILKGSNCQESAVRSGCVRPRTTVCNRMFKQVTSNKANLLSFHLYLPIKPNVVWTMVQQEQNHQHML